MSKETLSPEMLALLVERAKKKRAAEAAARAESGAAPLVAAHTIPRRPGAALGRPVMPTHAQQRLWLLEQIDPGNTAYNISALLRLSGALDFAALAGALTEVVRRHEALRTTFLAADGVPVQRIGVPSVVLPSLVDLSHLPSERARNLARTMAHEVGTRLGERPFDLAHGPLLRAALVRVASTEHLFSISIHHIVSDGWSLGVLFRELDALYRAARERKPSPLAEPALQFADFAVWQRAHLAGDRLASLVAYWREQLRGAAPMLELPSDHLRPAQSSSRGDRVVRTLPPEISGRLREVARSFGATPFMVVHALFALLASRLAGQDDVVVGSPSAGRDHENVEGVVGLFLNTLVLRLNLAGAPTFRELVRRAREVLLGAYQHQELPFEKLIEEVQPDRNLSHTPIFQVLLNYVAIEGLTPSLGDLEVEAVENDHSESKFDLTLYANEVGESIELSLVFALDLFERARMTEFLAQFEQLATQALIEPERSIDSYSLLTPSALAVLPDPTAPLPTDWRGTVVEALTRWAETDGADPERLAVSDAQGELWSYRELTNRVRQLAFHLRASGVERGDTIGIWAHRGSSLPWAMLASLEAGGVVVLLDSAYPTARLASYLEIARPSAWITVAGAPEPPAEIATLAASFRVVVNLPTRSEAERSGFLASLPSSPLGLDLGPDDPAILTFTSGSTGTPKGVVGRHGPLTHYYPFWAECFGLGADDRFGMLSALAHDPLQRDVFTPLWFGGAIVIPDPEQIGRRGYLASWVAEQAVTVLNLTPAMLELLLEATHDLEHDPAKEASSSKGERVTPLRTLRRAFVVGDVLLRSDVEKLEAHAPQVECVNLYGSTETQRSVSFHLPQRTNLARADGSVSRDVLPLGRGMDGVQLLVINRAGRLAGVGEPGEIHARSHHLAQGYLGDAALTAERFLANPFLAQGEVVAGDRLYRTGDVGRYLPNGEVEFAGRTDTQVKLRGFRIELGEVEAALARLPNVVEAAAVVRAPDPARPEDRRLVGFVVLEPEVTVFDANAARSVLAAKLPDYMVPWTVVALDVMPKTGTGKIDRRALPTPSLAARSAAHDAGEGESSSPFELLLAGLWSELLGVDLVRPDDDFFALGGQSLAAARLSARVHDQLGLDLPPRAVFENPTLRALAARLEKTGKTSAGVGAAPPLARLDEAIPPPLSFAQQRLWTLHQVDPTQIGYHLAGVVEIRGALDHEALVTTLAELVRRHETLRTTFEANDNEGGVRLRIADVGEWPLEVVDLSALASPEREREAAHLAGQFAERPFDLAVVPPIRSLLITLGPDLYRLATVVHHVAADGWSLGLLGRELAEVYAAAVLGLPSPLASHLSPPLRYRDFAAWQRDWLSGDTLARQLDYWRGHLAGAPPVLELPLDRSRPAAGRAGRALRVYAPLGVTLDQRVAAAARGLGATPFMIHSAIYALLLSRLSGQDEVVLGTPIANRGRVELETIVGLFANTLALRIDLGRGSAAGGPSFAELVRRVREVALGAYAHQDLPFERLVEELRPERDLRHTPIFQAFFAFQNLPASEIEMAGLHFESIAEEEARVAFDLSIAIEPAAGADGGARLRVDGAADVWLRSSLERLAERYVRLLEAAVLSPDRQIAELPLLNAAEREQLLTIGRGPTPEIPDLLLHELFERTAAERPDAIALVFGAKRMSFSELDVASAALAARLRALGIGPDERVAVALDRSALLVVALLGVLRAGGAYVPLDPSYPIERRAYILEASGARVVLAEGDLGALDPGGATVVRLDQGFEPTTSDSRQGSSTRTFAPTAENLAYVLFTSGSTGKPKGVAIRHRSAVNFLAAMAARPGLGSSDAVVAITTVAFDISVLELFLPLAVGARIELVDREVGGDGALLAERIESSAATVLQATPATWRMLLEAGWRGRTGSRGLKALCGGEALPPDLAVALLERTGELWNVYGPTETTVWSAVGQVVAADLSLGDIRPVPIGTPIDHTEVHVVESFVQGFDLVPLGVAGELLIGGEGLARGYLGRPDLTAERFVPDPFSGRPGARVYRTGDLVRRVASFESSAASNANFAGESTRLEFLGRIDHQVKINGFRIELGEIEAALVARSEVKEGAVVVREDTPGEKRLAAYVALTIPAALEPERAVETLRAALAETLPEYMVPALWSVLDALPLTPNGKTDRKALLALDPPQATTLAFAAPTTPTEVAIAQVWSEILKLERVGVDESFFSLGGDSVLAIRVATRCRKLGFAVTPRLLHEHRTVAALAAWLDSRPTR